MVSFVRRRLFVVAATAAAAMAGVGMAAPAIAAGSPATASPAVAAPSTRALSHVAKAAHAANAKRGDDPAITVNIGGVRPSATATVMNGIPGVEYRATGNTNGDTATCTTTAASPASCRIDVTSAITQTYTVAPVTTPASWFENPGLGVSSGTPPAANPATPYATFTTGALGPGGSATVPTASNTSALASRGSQVAFSRTDEREPTTCGLKVALVFDLSTSIISPTNHLATYLAAGQSFVNALEGTPSSIAVYTFGTGAPAAGANNATLAPTPVSTAAGASEVRNHIAGLTVTTGNFTNWDAGLWQVANSGEHYDAVIMLTDGDPTRNGRPNATAVPPGTGVTTRFTDVENGIFSANAVKAEPGTSLSHQALLAVGIDVPSPGSRANLLSISGPGDFFTTNFSGLESTLDSLAKAQCQGTVNVTKLVVPPGEPDAAGAPASGWEFHSTHPAESQVTDENGTVSFRTGDSTADTTVTETAKSGYTPIPARTSCRNTVTGEPVSVTHVTGGFTVTPDPDGIIACEVVNQAPAHPGIEISKTAFPTEYGVAGEEITYTFEVSNTGNTLLSAIKVVDDKLGPIVCPRNELGVGESMTCRFDYTTTEHDVAAGAVHNAVTVTGHDPGGREVTDSDDDTVTRDPGSGIQLQKTAFPTEYGVAGEVISYTYRVVNTGSSPLHDVTLADSRLGDITCPHTVLEPGAEMDCTATHTVTDADVAAGHIRNVATVTGHDPEGTAVDDTDQATVTARHAPGLQIEKTASRGTFSAAGQRVSYNYRVVNTGTVTVHGVSVSDSKAGVVANCGLATLHPGQQTTCTAAYTVTQADVDRGYIPNFAFARAVTPDGSALISEYAEAIVTAMLPEVPVTG